MPETEPDLCGRMLGGFVLRERIDGGGFATVYRCEQLWLGREVVVKVLRQELTEREQERFRREAELASRLDHPYAAHVYAFGVEEKEGLSWIAMELVRGVPLSHWLKRHGAMSLEQLVPLFERIAEVVEAAHERGIVHRDLKPSNVMVVERDGSRFPKLLDLGIAKICHDASARSTMESGPDGSVTGTLTARLRTMRPRPPRTHAESGSQGMAERLTPSNILLGSPPYMAPEQWSDTNAVGPATDIYALGIVVYEALTGYVPFVAGAPEQWYQRHHYGLVPPLRPPALDEVIQRALAKEPHERQRSVQELASELRGVLRASPREQLRCSAQRWDDQGRPRGLLWGTDMLAALACWPGASSSEFTEVERAFLATSRRRARLAAWGWRSLVALVVAAVVSAVLYRAAMQTQRAQEQARAAQRVTEAVTTQAELEQGSSALLHGELEAQLHLGRAYHRGDHSPSTQFMYARALQPRLAEQARFTSSFGRMWSATFSPDGRQIVTTDDRAAQVRDAQTYRILFVLPHGSEVYQAVYSADGARLITAAGDAVRIWDASRGALVRRLTQRRSDGGASDYFIVALSHDGRFVAAINAAGSVVHVWDTSTGVLLAELHNDPMEFPGLAFSSDGHWLAMTGGKDVHVFDTSTWQPACTIHGPRIQSLAFDPIRARLVTGTARGDVAIWAIPSGARIHHLREIGEPVEAVAVSPDGQLVVAASRDGAEQIWQAGSGELQSQFNARHAKILAVEFDRTSKLVLAADTDGTVVVADAAQGMPITVLEGSQNPIHVAHFDPSSRRVVGASRDGTAWIWDATSPYRRWSSPPIASDCGLGTSAEPDGRFIAVGCRDHATRIWDTSRDQLLAELPSVSHGDGDFTSAFPAVSPAGDRAAIARGNTVEVYELPGGRLLRTIVHGALVNTVAFATTERDIVSGAVDGSLIVTHDNGATLALPISSGGIDTAEFLPDGRVVAADEQRRLRVYAFGGAVLADLEIPVRVMSLRIDGSRLVTVPIAPMYTTNTAPPLLLDLERYRVISQLQGHVGRIFSARWVAGNQILTAGADGTTRLWDGSTGKLRQVYRGGSRYLADAALTPHGLVIAGGADGLLRFWDANSGRLLWALQAHKSQLIGVHVEGTDIVTRGSGGELSRWALPRSEQVIEACDDRERCAIMQGP
jgi:WD40 repeat protein/serine/threonine protein kinase